MAEGNAVGRQAQSSNSSNSSNSSTGIDCTDCTYAGLSSNGGSTCAGSTSDVLSTALPQQLSDERKDFLLKIMYGSQELIRDRAAQTPAGQRIQTSTT